MIKFTVPGRPVPKGRPRTSKAGGKTIVYTPKTTSTYEKQVGYIGLAAAKGYSFLGDIEINIRLYFKDQRIGDVDNYAKSILDGLQGTVFENDKQVARLCVSRGFDIIERAEVEVKGIS